MCTTTRTARDTIENRKKKIISETVHIAGEASETGDPPVRPHPSPELPTSADDEPDLTDIEVCPYPGLAFFRPSEARWFFGREQATAAVISQFGVRLAGGGPLAVMAPSGAGKSSLLAAGVIPALARGDLPGSRKWPVVVTTPGAHPLATLAARVAQRIGVDSAEVPATTADPERFTAFLAAYVGKQRETCSSAQIVLIVDQFEEVFTECQQESERQAFIAALCSAAHSGTALVLFGMRADFYGSCLEYPELATALQNLVNLGPMTTDQLRSIITGPAEAENLEVEPGLVELLLRDLEIAYEPGAAAVGHDLGGLPLLAHALQKTWEERSGRLLTVAGYRRTGGIHKAIATTAESVYTQLDSFEQRLAEQLLLRLVNVSEHTRALRRRLSREWLVQALPEPAETSDKILETFGRARLLTLDTTSVEITHEALLWAWPRLADWIKANSAGLRIRQMLSDAADAWKVERRDSSQLCRGSRLTIFQGWAADPAWKAQLSGLEIDYLKTSIDRMEWEKQAERRRTRNLRTLVGVLAAALVMVLLVGSVAARLYYEKGLLYYQASKLSNEAISTELAARSSLFAAKYPDAAMMLAVEAFRKTETPSARALGALLSAQSQYFAGRLVGHEKKVNDATFSPHGKILATAGEDGTVRLWDAVGHHQIDILERRDGPIDDIDFSPDGSLLAIAGHDGTVWLWNLINRQIRHAFDASFTSFPSSAQQSTTRTFVKFSHDGKTLATVSRNLVQLWNVSNNRRITRLPEASVEKVVFSPDDQSLAIVGSSSGIKSSKFFNDVVLLVDVMDANHPKSLSPPFFVRDGTVESVSFSPDGATLITAGSDRTAQFWDLRERSRPRRTDFFLDGHSGAISSVVFSPDGNHLLTGSYDGTARLWDAKTRQQIGIFSGHHGGVAGVEFNSEGNRAVTVSDDKVVTLWNVKGPILTPSPFPINQYGKVEFSPDGSILAVTTKDGILLWDPVGRREIGVLPGHIIAMKFSESRNILATATMDTVRLWNLTDLQTLSELSVSVGYGGKMTFSPNGEILAIATDGDKKVELWSTADPRKPEFLRLLMNIRNDFVKDISFSRKGHILAVASTDRKIQLWDFRFPRNPALKTELTMHTNKFFIRQLVFSSDDSILAIIGGDGIVQRRKVESGDDLGTVEIPPFPGSRLHVYDYDGFSFDEEIETMVTSNEDRTEIILWRMGKSTGIHWATLTGHASSVTAASFNRHDRLLATIDGQGTVRIWDLDPDRVAARLCKIIGTVSREAWNKFFPSDVNHNPACR